MNTSRTAMRGEAIAAWNRWGHNRPLMGFLFAQSMKMARPYVKFSPVAGR